MAPGIDVGIDSPLARVALRDCILTAEESSEAKCDCLLEALRHYIVEIGQIRKLVLETDAAMRVIYISLLDMKKSKATIKTEQVQLKLSNAELLKSARWKEAKSTCMGNSFIETIPPMCFRFALNVEKFIVTCYCEEVSEIVPLTSEQ